MVVPRWWAGAALPAWFSGTCGGGVCPLRIAGSGGPGCGEHRAGCPLVSSLRAEYWARRCHRHMPCWAAGEVLKGEPFRRGIVNPLGPATVIVSGRPGFAPQGFEHGRLLLLSSGLATPGGARLAAECQRSNKMRAAGPSGGLCDRKGVAQRRRGTTA